MTHTKLIINIQDYSVLIKCTKRATSLKPRPEIRQRALLMIYAVYMLNSNCLSFYNLVYTLFVKLLLTPLLLHFP